MMQKIDAEHIEHPAKGVVGMTDYLLEEGYKVGLRKVRRMMRLMGIMLVLHRKHLSKLGSASYIGIVIKFIQSESAGRLSRVLPINSSLFISSALVSGPIFSFSVTSGVTTPLKLTPRVEHQAARTTCTDSRLARFTTFAVWIPKKINRISVDFILAAIFLSP